MSATHWFLVLNGKSAGDDALRAAVATMRDRGIRIDVRVTWEDGDAARIVGEAIAAGAHAVIAAGGDGTLSEVADEAEKLAALLAIVTKYAGDERYVAAGREQAINSLAKTAVFKMTVEHLSGKARR